MAILSNVDRAAESARYQSDASSTRDPLPILRADLRAAIDAVDDWVDANAASFNSALPVAARTGLTAKQKASLLVHIVRRRFEVA